MNREQIEAEISDIENRLAEKGEQLLLIADQQSRTRAAIHLLLVEKAELEALLLELRKNRA